MQILLYGRPDKGERSYDFKSYFVFLWTWRNQMLNRLQQIRFFCFWEGGGRFVNGLLPVIAVLLLKNND